MIATMYPACMVFGRSSKLNEFAGDAQCSLLFISNLCYIEKSTDYFSPESFTPFIHTWSLSSEMQMWALITLFVIAGSLFSRRRFSVVILATSLGVYIVSILLALSPEVIFYSPLMRIWEFVAGGIAAEIKYKNNKSRRIGPFIPLAILLVIMLTDWPRLQNESVNFQELCLKAGVVLVSALYLTYSREPRATSGVLIFFGNISYSLYLFHMPILYLAKFSPLLEGADRSLPTILGVICSILIAYLSWTKVELRGMQLKS